MAEFKSLEKIFENLNNVQKQRQQEFQKKQSIQSQMNRRLDQGPISASAPINVSAPVISPPKTNGWDWNTFGQSFVRSTGKMIDAVIPFTDPIQQGVIKGMNEDNWFNQNTRDWLNEAFQKPTDTKQKVLDGVTEIGASLIPIAGAYKSTDLGLDAINKVPKAFKGLNQPKGNAKVLDEVQRGAGAGLVWGTQNEINKALNGEDVSLGSAATNISLEMGLGGVLDAIPSAIRIGRQAVKESKAALPQYTGQPSEGALQKLSPQPQSDLLQQPMSDDIFNQLSNMGKRPPEYNKPTNKIDDSWLQFGQQSSNIPKARFQEPDIRIFEDMASPGGHRPVGYWKQRYEDFVKHVNENYDTSKLNQEVLEDLWSSFAKNDEDVTLNELADLYAKDVKRVNEDISTQMKGQFAQSTKPKARLPQQGEGNIDENLVNRLLNLKNTNVTPSNAVKQADNIELKSSEIPISTQQTVNLEPVPNVPVNNVVELPTKKSKSEPPKQNERSFYSTVEKSEKMTDEMKQRLDDFDKTYTPMSNKETVKYANKYIEKDIEKAYQFVKNARKFDPRHVTVGHRLIDEFQKRGEFDKALDVVERLAEQGTKAGQSIQAFSIYNRLTAQGQLLRAQRIVNKVNETQGKKIALTPETQQSIVHAADSLQKFTGQEEVGKEVMGIVDKWKKGEAPIDADVDKIKEFFAEAKKFVNDLDPKAQAPKPQKINDTRTRDKVIDFMSKQEEIAKKRLKARMKRANSLPVDVFYDLSIIGASKVAKGTIKFADFSEQMVKEFGKEIQPYMKSIYNKAVETFNLQSSTMTAKRLSEVEKIVNKALKDKQLAEEQMKAVQMYLKDYLSMTGDAKLEASMNLQATLQLLERPTIAGKLSTTQTIMQLLNPKTMIRNALGNELFYRVEQLNKLVATPIDIAKSKLTGSERTVTFKTNAQGNYWKYWMQGLKAGWRGVNPMGLQTAYDLGPQAFRSKYNPLTYLEKALGATLRSFDNAGYMRAYNKTLGEISTLRALNEGLKGKALKEAVQKYMREADVNIMKIADQYGKYATFQDNTMLSTALQKTKKGLNKVSTLGITDEFGAGDLILKYPKTPGNLIMRALEYSPAGFIRTAHLIKDFRKVKSFENHREMVLSLTRAITGTGGFSMLGYVLADKGILTSSGHSDYEVSQLERYAGKQSNSINVSALMRFIESGFNLSKTKTQEGDTFVTYDWAQPVSMAIALGTGVSQSVKEDKELNAANAAKKAGDSAFNTIIDQSVLSGLNDFLASYPGRTMSDRIADVAKGAAGSFVPTFLNQIRQLNDNTSRNTYDPNPLKEMLNKAQNRIPGLDKKLPPSYDTLGKQREVYQDGGNNIFNVLLNPSFVSKYKPSKEAKLVLDVFNQTGDKTIAPRNAQKYLMVNGQKIELTGKQHSEYQRIMGEYVSQALKGKSFNNSNVEETIKGINKILTDAGKKARDELKSKDENIRKQIEMINKMKK